MTIEEYYNACVQTFEQWLADHEDQDTWISNNVEQSYSDVNEAFESNGGQFDNDYIGYFFDWKQAAYAHMVSHSMVGFTCEICGDRMVYEYGESEACQCEQEGLEGDHEEMEDDDILEYVTDCEFMISEWSLEATLPEAFEEYHRSLMASFGGVVETIREGYTRLTEWDDVQDLMATLLYVTTVYHAGGNLLEDHSYDLDSGIVDDVRDGGMLSVWEREEIEEFMSDMEV